MIMTEEEAMILLLYKECDSVEFKKHDATESDAINFTKLTSTPEFNSSYTKELGVLNWFTSKHKNIQATAFLKRGESN